MRWLSVSFSGKFARILPAREISHVSTSTPVPFVNTRTIGRKEYVASAGPSSVFVQMIFDVLVAILSLLWLSGVDFVNRAKDLVTMMEDDLEPLPPSTRGQPRRDL